MTYYRQHRLNYRKAGDGRSKIIGMVQTGSEENMAAKIRPPTLHNSYETMNLGALNSRRISEDVDRKVVIHLRKRLSQRRRESLINLDDDDDDEIMSEEKKSRNVRKIGPDKQLDIPPVSSDIYSKYTEYGDKVKSGKSVYRQILPKKPNLQPLHESPRPNKDIPKPNIQNNTSSQSSLSPSVYRSTPVSQGPHHDSNSFSDSLEGELNRYTPLPNISTTHQQQEPGDHREDKNALNSGRIFYTDASTEKTDVESSILTLTNDGKGKPPGENKVHEEEEEEDISFLNTVVSPVPTPLLFRPETREQGRISLEDKVLKIVQGRMNIKMPPDTKSVRVFINSAFTDTEIERTALIERVYPNLKFHFLERGYNLEIIDLHWGSRDMTLDDHSQIALCLNCIEKCQENNRCLNFVTFIGHKYGAAVLPSTISVEEFEAINTAVLEDHRRQVAAAEAEAEEAAAIQSNSISDSTDDHPEKMNSMDKNVAKTSMKKSSIVEQKTLVTSGHNEARFKDKFKSAASVMKKENGREGSFIEKTENGESGFLCTWYKLDKNTIPPVYRLQPISSQYKDFIRNDPNKRSQARQKWLLTAKRIQKLLYEYSVKTLDPDAANKYTTSLAEIELEHGMLSTVQDPNQVCFWFQRDVEDIRHHVHDQKIRDYVDLVDLNPNLDTKLTHALDELREKRLPDALSSENIWRFSVPWHSNGITASSSRLHGQYIDRMCKEFQNVLTRRLETCLEQDADRIDHNWPVFKEVVQHVHYSHQRSKTFYGRKDLLECVKKYIRSKCAVPLLIHGQSGCGKTSLLAKAAKESHHWLKGKCSVVLRMVGVTSDSHNIRLLLRTICHQLCEIYGQDPACIPHEFKGLQNDFNQRLLSATEEKPLLIIIDALNRLSDENDAHKLTWLPKQLPPNVHMLVSTLPGDECMKHLRKAFVQSPEAFLEIPELPLSDATAILDHWFNYENRTLTPEQYDVVIEGFKHCPLPLYLRLAFNEALKWPSYIPDDELKLAESIKKLVSVIFVKLERNLGEPLVRRALGYLTASRNGVTVNEMEDLLSLDDAVMDDVCAHTALGARRLPPLHSRRLLNHLDEFLEETIADGAVVLRWAHMQFAEAAEDRYLKQKDKAPSYHKAIAEYFLEKWLHAPKLHPGVGKGSLRHILPQPLFTVLKSKNQEEPERRVYNLRRLNELPYHLLEAQQFDTLKRECLCNFDFILAKICGTSLRAAFEDIQMGQELEPGDSDLKLLSDALHLSTSALIKDPRQLASQMVGRLHSIITKDIPVAPNDPVKYPFMKMFFRQAMNTSSPVLLPSTTCLTPPGGVLFDLLSGHNEPITAVITTSDGQRAVTTSLDDTMKVWELRTGRVSKTLSGVGADVISVRLCAGNTCAITSELNCIRIWNLNTGKLLKTINGLDDPACITTAKDGQLIVAFFDGSGQMKTWNMEHPDIPLIKEIKLDDTADAIHKDNSILVAINSAGISVLHAHRGAHTAKVRNAKTGIVVKELKQDNGSITALAVSREYFILAVRMQYMKLHEIYALELFDSRNGHFIRSVRGCINDRITELYVNQLGSHVLAICTSEASDTSDIALWNVETEDHKHLARHSKASKFGACVDMRYFLTASQGDNTMRIWNLSAKVNQQVPKEKVKDGLESIIPMNEHSKYVICKSLHTGPITVWNMTSTKPGVNPVRLERGLVDTSDTLLLHNTKAVILTEKGFSTTSEGAPPMFRKVHIYDLVQKRYVHKLGNCYIVPSQPHEYVFLSDDLLMGLSENRTHFVVWTLQTGLVVHRIKANLRELDKNKGVIFEDANGFPKKRRNPTAEMLPWERRTETKTARKRRHQAEIDEEREKMDSLRKERENSIEQFIVSKDLSTIVASYYAHHMCVFDVTSQTHIQTLENPNSMLFLHVAALTGSGSHLVHANYDDDCKVSYVTMWDCQEGVIKKRLKNEKNVCTIAISDTADKVVFGKTNNELRIWTPNRANSLKRIKGYAGLQFGVGSKIFIIDGGHKVVVYAGDISVWDLDNFTVLAIFTPDMKIQCFNIAMDNSLMVFGLRDTSEVITMRLTSQDTPPTGNMEANLFGEAHESSDEEDEHIEDDE